MGWGKGRKVMGSGRIVRGESWSAPAQKAGRPKG